MPYFDDYCITIINTLFIMIQATIHMVLKTVKANSQTCFFNDSWDFF